MKNYLFLIISSFVLGGAVQLQAEGSDWVQSADSCLYKLDLFDSLGDGWNNNSVVVTAGNTSLTVTLETGTAVSYPAIRGGQMLADREDASALTTAGDRCFRSSMTYRTTCINTGVRR